MVRIIALGQAAAGDDGVAFAVLDELGRRGLPAGTERLRIHDPIDLLTLLETPARVVLIDAAVGPLPGEVLDISADELPRHEVPRLSSHAIGVRTAIELARLTSSVGLAPSIRIVAVGVERPDRMGAVLTACGAAAVGKAADRVLEILGATPMPPRAGEG